MNGSMSELRNAIEDFNHFAATVRDKLHDSVPIPFHVDPLLRVVISFDEPIPLDKHVALEFFNKRFMEISSVIIENQKMVFFFNSENGEDTDTYEILLYDNVKDIMGWEYYLITLVSHVILSGIKGAREEAEAFLSKLTETIDVGKEGNE